MPDPAPQAETDTATGHDLREYAEAIDKSRGYVTGTTRLMRFAADELAASSAALEAARKERDELRVEADTFQATAKWHADKRKAAESELAALRETTTALSEALEACDRYINWDTPRIIPSQDVPNIIAAFKGARSALARLRAGREEEPDV